jgi:glucokinase
VIKWRLVADVGGSNVRFARSRASHTLADRRSYPLNRYSSFYDALAAFLNETGGVEACASAVVGVAGPVDGGYVKLTNADWVIEADRVGEVLGGAPARVVNDLQAVALALPHLRDDELEPVGAARRKAGAAQTMLALNVGTGFGAAAAIPVGHGWFANPGEPGHMTLGACNSAETEILAGIPRVEEALSGRGIRQIYANIARRAGRTPDVDLSAADIFAMSTEDEIAAETLRQSAMLLGRVAGDIVLAVAAWGGIYLCGSVVNGLAKAGGGKYFRKPFEDKGPMSRIMENVYSGLITCDDVALLGLTHLPVDGA